MLGTFLGAEERVIGNFFFNWHRYIWYIAYINILVNTLDQVRADSEKQYKGNRMTAGRIS